MVTPDPEAGVGEDGTARWAAHASKAMAVVALALVIVAAVAWRVPWMDLPYTSDEVGTVSTAGSWWAVVGSQESGVNPPLLRLLNLVTTPWDTPWWGRRLAFVSSVASVIVGAWVGWRTGGRTWGLFLAVAVAALLAVHPQTVRYGTLFRAYAPWSLTCLLLLGGLGAAVGDDARRRPVAWACAGLAAGVLPWWHYLSVPVLLGMAVGLAAGRDTRRAAIVPVVGLVSITPMLPFMIGHTGRRVAPHEPLEETLRKLTSLGLEPPWWVREAVLDPWGRTTGLWLPLGDVMGGLFVVAAVGALVGWGRLSAIGRASWGGLIGLGVAILVVGRVQYVRPSTIVMVVTLLGPALAALVMVPSHGVGRVLLAALFVAWIGPAIPPGMERFRTRLEDARGVDAVIARWPTWAAGGRPVAVHPAREVWTLYFHLARQHPRLAPRDGRCEGWDPCAAWADGAMVGLDRLSGPAEFQGVVVSLDRYRDPGFAAGCRPLDGGRGWAAWACDPASTALRREGPGPEAASVPAGVPPR